MRVGILGYGNLGRALAHCIENTPHTLVAVFSRRAIHEDKIPIVKREEIKSYEGSIDTILIATSSHSEASADARELLPLFNTVDSYDNHKMIPRHLRSLRAVAKASGKVAITAAGWDPGILSVARAMARVSLGAEGINTFWGAGKSLGHTSALMSIEGVKYAVQYTVPKSEAIALAKNTDVCIPDTDRHWRECFIVPEEGADLDAIGRTVRNTEGYFKGYHTAIRYITEDEFFIKHKRDFHSAEVISTKIEDEKKTSFDLKIDIPSNARFTAKIMLSYLNAINSLQNSNNSGAYTPLDIPMSYLISDEEYGDLI